MLGNYKEVMEKTQKRVLALAHDVLKAYTLTVEASEKKDTELATQARSMLKDAHDRNNKIDNEIIRTLALFSPEAKDLRIVVAYLKITSELSRIADYVRSFAKKVKMQISGELDMSALQNDMQSFLESTKKSLEAAVASIEADSEEALENLYRKVNVEEKEAAPEPGPCGHLAFFSTPPLPFFLEGSLTSTTGGKPFSCRQTSKPSET